jgi:hypothetical protein
MTECAYNMFNGAVASGYIIELAHLRTLPPNLDFEFASNCWGTPFKVLHLLCLLVRVFQIYAIKILLGVKFFLARDNRLMRETESPFIFAQI